MGGLDLPVFDDEGVALGAVVAEDGGGVESEVQVFGEFAGGVAEEADLRGGVSVCV